MRVHFQVINGSIVSVRAHRLLLFQLWNVFSHSA